MMIAILLDEDGGVQVLPLDGRGAERSDAVRLQQGERFMQVPYSTWREFLGRTTRLAEVQARATAQWPLPESADATGSGRCPTCDEEFERGVVAVRAPAPNTTAGSIVARLQWRPEEGGRWKDLAEAFAERPAWRCRKCGGVWIA